MRPILCVRGETHVCGLAFAAPLQAGNTPLHHSAIHEDVAAALQAAGANVAARNLAGQTAEDTRRALETRKAAGMPARPPQSDAEVRGQSTAGSVTL